MFFEEFEGFGCCILTQCSLGFTGGDPTTFVRFKAKDESAKKDVSKSSYQV